MPKLTLDRVLHNKHLHWEFIAYVDKTETGQWIDATAIRLIGYSTEEEALATAKKTIQRPYYFLRDVNECSQCSQHEESLRLQQEAVKNQEKLLEKLIKHLD